MNKSMDAKFINKQFNQLSTKEKDEIRNPFICLHSNTPNGIQYFQFMVVDLNKSEDSQFIARFKRLELAKEYLNFIIEK